MTQDTAARRDPNLEQMAKNIFGDDIVDSAYVTTYNFTHCVNDAPKRLDDELYEKVEDEIDLDSKDIIIKFKNGNAIILTNSEWGCLASIDLSDCRMC